MLIIYALIYDLLHFIYFDHEYIEKLFLPFRKKQTTESINKLLAQITGENNEQLWIFL